MAELKADLTGSGDIDASELKVGKAMLKSHGPGGVELAHVSDSLDAELRGSGSLTLSVVPVLVRPIPNWVHVFSSSMRTLS